MMKPLPDIDQAYNLILQEEKQSSITAMSQFTSGSSAFNANFLDRSEHSSFATQQRSYNSGFQQRGSHISGYKSGQNQGFFYHNSNSTQKTIRFGNRDKRQQLYCDHCKMAGHTVQTCYNLHGYPPDHKLYKSKRMAALAQTYAGSEYNSTQA